MEFIELNWDGVPRGSQFMLEITGLDMMAMRAYPDKIAGTFRANGYTNVKVRDTSRLDDRDVVHIYFDAERVVPSEQT